MFLKFVHANWVIFDNSPFCSLFGFLCNVGEYYRYIKGGGGGGGVRPIIKENLFLKCELKGTARTRTDILRVVLGPCAQCCPCESSKQKWDQKPTFTSKEIEL